jgi:lipopolysaccharide export system permease protein
VLNKGLELADAVFFELDQNGDLVERKDAKRAFLKDGYWLLQGVDRYKGGERLASETEMKVATSLKPEFVQERLARPETIPLFELPGKIDAAHSFGLRASRFRHAVPFSVALPLLMVAMTLIAATVSMRFARMGQSATMILGGIVAGFLLYVVSVLVRAFGNAGIMPPVIAAWFPVIVAMFFGGDVSFVQGRWLVRAGTAERRVQARPARLYGATALACLCRRPDRLAGHGAGRGCVRGRHSLRFADAA